MRVALLVLAPLCLFGQNTLLVGHKWADSVGYYDASTGKALATIPVGVRPHEMAFSADRKHAFVTNYGVNSWTQSEQGTNTISIIDVAGRKEAGRIELGKHYRPHGIELGHTTGRLFVTTDFPASVLIIDPNRRSVVKQVEVGQKAPHMLAVTRDETRAYVANSGSGTVTVLPLDGSGKPRHIETGGVPMGIALSEDEAICYVTTRTNNQMVAIDTKSNTISHRIPIAGQPVRLRLLPGSREAIVPLIESGEVAVIDLQSRKEKRRLKVGANAEGIHVDESAGHLYVSAQGDNKVVKFDLRTWKPLLEIPTAARPDPILQF